MKKRILACLCVFLIVVGTVSQEEQIEPDAPPNGFVPNEETAIKIAEAVWTHMYGKKRISKEKPFKARLTNDVWIVRGSLPRGFRGGVAVAEISKTSGCILKVFHGK